MNKILSSVLLLVVCFCSNFYSFANHLLGGEIGYQYISTNGNVETYKVTLSFFADCASQYGGAYEALPTAIPMVKLYNGTALVSSQTLSINSALSNIDITPVCPDDANYTTCVNPSNSIPGITKWVYEGTFTLTGTSANWKFAFEGSMGSTNAGRSNIIGNANVNGGSSLMYLMATLDNTTGTNSTPTFTSLPAPFFCVGHLQNYSLGAVDPDNDNMTFDLIPAKTPGTPPGNITYYTPYSGTNPLPTAAGNFAFNGTNGQMTFTPSLALNCVVVNSVNEYRNGALVGTSMREMTFVLLDNCSNDAPVGPITNTDNVTVIDSGGQQMFEVCAGQSAVVSYDINSSDVNGDNVNVTWTNLPTGSAIIVDNNGTPNPTVHFLWNVTNAIVGNYTFYITYTDDGCPLASSQTIAYTLQVLPFDGQFNSGTVSPCINMQNGLAWLAPNDTANTIPFDYYWYDNTGALVQTDTNITTPDTLFNIGASVYNVKVASPEGCYKYYQIAVPTPFYDISINYTDTVACINSALVFGKNSSGSISSWTWNFGDGSPNVNNQQILAHYYNTVGNYTVSLIGYDSLGCSDTDTVNVQIVSQDSLNLLIDRDSICEGDKIHFTAQTGVQADSLFWNIGNDWLSADASVNNYTDYAFDQPGMYPVTVTATYAHCPTNSTKDTVWVFPYPTVNIGNDTSLCLNGDPIILHNLVSQPNIYKSLWNTGDTTSTITVTHPGKYSLTVTSDQYCKTTDEITINKDCYIDIPNGFTPNGDGVNDYFLPRNLLSKGITQFKMQIFDRWGQMIFETENITGRGWDGKFNAKEQPVGVYIYQIDVTIKNDKNEHYTGNLSLIR